VLREIHISQLAVIEDLTIELGDGLNCFTGRTGAGKSLIIGAFEILLGLRSGSDMIRPGAQEARVTGVFDLHDPHVAQKVAAAIDQPDLAPGEPLLITRKLYASGRTGVSVNGIPVPSGTARQVGELLVDIHGQHDHQFLLKPGNQLDILDEFSKALPIRKSYSDAYQALKNLIATRNNLGASVELRRQQRDLYEFQANEIDEAKLVSGEFEELRQRHALLSNVEKIKREAGQAHSALYDADAAVIERLQIITQILSNLSELDPALAPIADQVKTGTSILYDAAFELGRHVDRLEINPGELEEIDDRLNTINRLVSKYTGPRVSHVLTDPPNTTDSVDLILAYREKIGSILDSLITQDTDQSQVQAKIDQTAKEILKLGAQLTTLREAGGKQLKPLIEAQLQDLGMSEAKLTVEFIPAPESLDLTPVPDPSKKLAAGPSGLQTIEILVSTNPGQPTRPLRKIASGGELSRIMLALKSILAQTDRVSVLVFDEIDSNIGGRMGTVIGTKLRALARPSVSPDSALPPEAKPKKPKKSPSELSTASTPSTSASGHQVLCITHLPQIAAFADRHFRIEKSVQGEGDSRSTSTAVTRLEGDNRIEELAEMLTGRNITETTRTQIRELIASAGK
jgi:DNA repair protein RecN (Recombination protein N)